jgi:hypothetical protein
LVRCTLCNGASTQLGEKRFFFFFFLGLWSLGVVGI